jgi:hypothetical protein
MARGARGRAEGRGEGGEEGREEEGRRGGREGGRRGEREGGREEGRIYKVYMTVKGYRATVGTSAITDKALLNRPPCNAAITS